MILDAEAIFIYKATSPSGKVYIGITNNLRKRITKHLSDVRSGSKLPFHNAIRKYGESNITWEIIDKIEDSKKFELERFYLNKFNSFNKGYRFEYVTNI